MRLSGQREKRSSLILCRFECICRCVYMCVCTHTALTPPALQISLHACMHEIHIHCCMCVCVQICTCICATVLAVVVIPPPSPVCAGAGECGEQHEQAQQESRIISGRYVCVRVTFKMYYVIMKHLLPIELAI